MEKDSEEVWEEDYGLYDCEQINPTKYDIGIAILLGRRRERSGGNRGMLLGLCGRNSQGRLAKVDCILCRSRWVHWAGVKHLQTFMSLGCGYAIKYCVALDVENGGHFLRILLTLWL